MKNPDNKANSFALLLSEKRCQSEWSSLYMLIILIIAALLLIAVIKPMFKQSQQVVKDTKDALK